MEKLKEMVDSYVQQELPRPREVTPVMKIRVNDRDQSAILTIWGAGEDSSYDVKEGSTMTMFNVMASGKRYSLNYGLVQNRRINKFLNIF